MSKVQITKRRENATINKLNVNLSLILEEVSLIFRRLEVVRSLPPPDDCEPSESQTTKNWKRVFAPRETQAGEYEVIIALARFKWLVH